MITLFELLGKEKFLYPILSQGMKKMEDNLIIIKVKENLGKVVKIIQQNNYIYKGKIINYDEHSLEILDFKSNSYHIIKYDYINHLEILE